jgi:hypothetical protein
MGDPVDLLPDAHRPVTEEVAESNEPTELVNVERLASRNLPQSDDIKRQSRIVPSAAATVDPEFAQVEEDSEIKMALIDVRADLTLVRSEMLSRTLGVEYERVCDQVDRCEVGLEPASAKLWKVRV